MKLTRPVTYFLAIIAVLFSFPVFSQRVTGIITGRVIADDGQPLPNALINLSGISSSGNKIGAGRMDIITDNEGNFVAEGLDPVPYLIFASYPSYIPIPTTPVSKEPTSLQFTHVGEAVTIQMVRGGIITGNVIDNLGKALIEIPVKAIRIRDEAGNAILNSDSNDQVSALTDDRGIYRIYGLRAGSYIVAAGGDSSTTIRATPFTGRSITYYPASTHDGATLVKVASSEEVIGIDIRYRGEKGYVISGKISGLINSVPSAARTPVVGISLRDSNTGEIIDTISFRLSQMGFTFYGITNGEYEIIAQTEDEIGENGMASLPFRVVIRNADRTGINLVLTPNASISGTVIIEKTSVETKACLGRREFYPEEIIVKAHRYELDASKKLLPALVPNDYGLGIPDKSRSFIIANLKSGRHHLSVKLPDERWYLKAATLSIGTAVNDLHDGVPVKVGVKIMGLNLTIASGAASMNGKLSVKGNLPLSVHLIPAEAVEKDNLLRFFETQVTSDGTFAFLHLAPGKYFFLVRPSLDSVSSNISSQPIAWNVIERTKIRREAESKNLVIELKTCQHLKDDELLLNK